VPVIEIARGQMPVDLKINRAGDLVAKTSLMGLLPVQITVDPEDVLAGRYGRQVALNFETPGKAHLRGDLQVEGFPVPELIVPDPGLGQGFKELQFQLAADHHVRFNGTVWMGPFELPFEADGQPRKVGNGLYEIAVSNVRLFGSIPIPAWLATWIARKVLDWTPTRAISRPAPDRLTFDLRNAFNGEAARGMDA